MAKIPDKAEHQRRFAALDVAQRRSIVRAVNRGQVVEVRKHAPLAVVLARRQQTLWRWAWLMGPAIGAFYLRGGWQLALANALLSTLVLGAVARFWYLRARRAEAANLALAEGRRKDAATISQTAWQARRADRRKPDGGSRSD